MYRIFLTTLILAFHTLLNAEIIEVYDLGNVQAHLQDLDSETLVLWDVDETLIIPGDNILHPNLDDIRKELMESYFSNKTAHELILLRSSIWANAPFKLLDPRSVEMIRELQDRNIPVMALTAMPTGSLGMIPCLAEWRYNQLKHHEIDFSGFLPQYPRLEWNQQLTFGWSWGKWNRTTVIGRPVFHKGILITDGLDKGPVLIEFFRQTDGIPKRVIFIDNDWNFLLSVQKSMETAGIPFLGVHYRAIEIEIAEVDRDLAHKQFHHLVHHGRWLNDEEAREIAQTQSL